MSSCLPDVNVWFALAVKEHSHHIPAVNWWEEWAEAVVFCRFTQMGLLRLLTSSTMMLGRPLNMDSAWSTYDAITSDTRVSFEREPDSLDPAFRRLSASRMVSPKLWMDFYLQAFAETSASTLVTFDRALASRCPAARLLP